MRHIYTKINATSPPKTHIAEILKKLYPTPALCGTPNKKAKNIINIIENFSRGWYGGAIGIIENNGEGNLYVPIRSALIKNNKIYFYSGWGILKESNLEKEWDETNLKLKHLKSAFNLK